MLAPLPSLRAEISAASVTRKADRLACAGYGSARYSVPTRLVGQRQHCHRPRGLLVVEPGTGAIVAEHELIAPERRQPSRQCRRLIDCSPRPAAALKIPARTTVSEQKSVFATHNGGTAACNVVIATHPLV